MRSLSQDGFRSTLVALTVAVVLMAVWGAWFFFAEVSIYAATDQARLEVDQEVHPIHASTGGRVIGSNMVLGRKVSQGELLVELDSESVRHQMDEAQAEMAALREQSIKLEDEMRAQEQALEEAVRGESSALDEARSLTDEAEAAARLAEEEAARLARMQDEGLLPEAERRRAAAEAEQRRSAAEAQERAVKRLEMDRRFAQSEKRALLAELERRAAELRGRLSSLEAQAARLAHELEQHRIRAPVAGRLGEVIPFRIGAVIPVGERLGSVVPPGEVKVVAEYRPPEALGRVRPGQPGRLRLEGFPWVQYGTVSATVARVAEETGNGRIRVELDVHGGPDVPIPLEHGLPGTLEVEVEKITPAALVLRAAGRAWSRPADSTAIPPGAEMPSYPEP
ncbi:MAG TPA: HlyD family efflux transporter periplasmic adaptor subunit [Vicinamibacteria bacterium]|nr:HlyD family efflux transporter periplasmic adaptor subunit [Vicinamibacteria bacterium]